MTDDALADQLRRLALDGPALRWLAQHVAGCLAGWPGSVEAGRQRLTELQTAVEMERRWRVTR